MDFLAAHWKPIGYAFVALGVVALLLALRHLTAVRGRRGPALVRPARPADALARTGPRFDEREFSGAVRPAVHPSRPPSPAPAVLGLENQIDGLQDTLIRRVDALERRIEKVERQLDLDPGAEDLAWSRPHAIDLPPTPSVPGGAWDREVGRTGSDSVISQSIVPGSGSSLGGGWDVASDGVGVEIRGSEVVASQSYPPEAYLTVRGGGVATVVLNPEVPHNSFALDRFALFFELGERRDGMYQTQTPAQVKWDGQRGTLQTPGRAVAR